MIVGLTRRIVLKVEASLAQLASEKVPVELVQSNRRQIRSKVVHRQSFGKLCTPWAFTPNPKEPILFLIEPSFHQAIVQSFLIPLLALRVNGRLLRSLQEKSNSISKLVGHYRKGLLSPHRPHYQHVPLMNSDLIKHNSSLPDLPLHQISSGDYPDLRRNNHHRLPHRKTTRWYFERARKRRSVGSHLMLPVQLGQRYWVGHRHMKRHLHNQRPQDSRHLRLIIQSLASLHLTRG